MRTRIPRRYDAVTKFLRETLSNPKIGPRVRMAAAMRLSDIYLAHDAARERRELAKLKVTAAKAEPAAPTVPRTEPSTTEPHAPIDAVEEARAFLARVTGEMNEQR